VWAGLSIRSSQEQKQLNPSRKETGRSGPHGQSRSTLYAWQSMCSFYILLRYLEYLQIEGDVRVKGVLGIIHRTMARWKV
jgi:hypothetical protein